MSTYTTEVRWIIQQITGLGPENLDESINNAWSKIFDFPFPMFDEDYRSVLCQKILKNYYTREIGYETVQLWKLRLNQKLNLIMPYYNKLYLTDRLEYNPLFDVDITTTHHKDVGTQELGHTENVRSDTQEGSSETVGKDVTDGQDHREENSVQTNTESRSSSTTANNSEQTNRTENRELTHSEQGIETGHSTDGREINTTTDTNGSQSGTENYTEGTTTSSNSSSRRTTDDKTKQSDTPQGSLSEWESDKYMSFGQIKSGSSEETQEGTGKTDVNHRGDSSGTSETNSTTNTTDTLERDTSTDRNVSGGGTDDLTVSGDVTGSHRETGSTQSSGESETTSQSNATNTVTKDTYSNTQNETSTSSRTTDDRSGTSATTEEYITKITGKNGGKSYASMVMEYRDSLINIDAMIIEELEDLFMQIW